jgi:hypothetical protein
MIMSIERGWPHDVEMPAIPWDDITKSPETYFDTKLLPVGVPLAKPESLSRGQVYILVDHIHTCQSAVLENDTTLHFAFRSKVEIQERLAADASTHDIDDQSSNMDDTGRDRGDEGGNEDDTERDRGDEGGNEDDTERDRGDEGGNKDDMDELHKTLETKYVIFSHLCRFNYLSINRKGGRQGNKNTRKRKSTSAGGRAVSPNSTRKKTRMSVWIFISNCILSLLRPHRSSPAGPALRARKRVDYKC